MHKLLHIGYYVFIAAVIFMGVLLLGSMAPIPGGWKVKVVLSGSMEPSMPVGSLAVIKPTASYEIGDVITFGKDGKKDIPTTHRIIEMRAEIGEMIYVTKGDANEDADTREVHAEEIIGKVLFDIPYLGFVLDMAKKPVGMLVLIIIPALIVIGDEVRKIVIEVKKLRARKKQGEPSSSISS